MAGYIFNQTLELNSGDSVSIYEPDWDKMGKLNNTSQIGKRADCFSLKFRFNPATEGNRMMLNGFYVMGLFGYHNYYIGEEQSWQTATSIGNITSRTYECVYTAFLYGRGITYNEFQPEGTDHYCKFIRLANSVPTAHHSDQLTHKIGFKFRSLDVSGESDVSETLYSNLITLKLPVADPPGPLDDLGIEW